MRYDLNGKMFRSVSNTKNGEVSSDTLFHYCQDNDIISANYHGGAIIKGHLVGKKLHTGQLEFVYHHINQEGHLMIGKCLSTPEFMNDGRLKFLERWQWMTEDKSEGESEIIEIKNIK